MKIKGILLASILAMSAVSGAYAQDSVRHLQDLIGARGGNGEYQMEQRGYRWVRTDKSSGDAYSYWRDNRSGRCVSIRTSQGRYASIVNTPDFDCQGGNEVDGSNVAQEQGDKFSTVCGVAVNGQSYRYRCEVVDIYKGNRLTKTVLHYPDQTLKLLWHGRNSVTVRVKGLADREARYSSSEGETNFRMDSKTYFFISNKDAARREVENFRD
jgi:opacity protein-like surface antigen